MIAAAIVVLIILFLNPGMFRSSYKTYTTRGGQNFNIDNQYSEIDGELGISSSLLPKEIPSQEEFGNFSPEVIMRGQNYLDPRAQVGYPETIGGVLRNANYDIRSEPQNPRMPVSIFNNSTIVPDKMRPQFEIGR
jgi:hypothetical protein